MIKRVQEAQHFQGLSSDIKPDSPNDGSTLHIIDTGEHYVFHDGVWAFDLTLIKAIQLSATL